MDMDAVEASNEPDRHCVSYRCRLCRFSIRVGETVVADLGNGRGRLSLFFPFQHHAQFEKLLNVSLQGCHLTCPHEEGDQLPAYHVECLEYAPPLTKEKLRATEYAYEPTTSEDPRRASRIQNLAARRLQIDCPFLPAEVCLLITKELARECAAIATHEMLQGRSLQALDCELDVSMPVWARYTSIDGIRYVESLSNTGDSHSVLLLGADRAPRTEFLYVLEDHLGIRQVVFASFEHALKLSAFLSKPKNDAWWQTVPITDEKLLIKTDGFKLRFIIAPSTQNIQDAPTVTWPKPMAPYQEPMLADTAKHIVKSEIRDLSRFHFRNMSVEFNDPAITGYSICWANGIRGIHAHYGMEKLAAYDDFDLCHETPTWIYMPIDPEERIIGIWTRSGFDPSKTGMMFETCYGRRVVVGYCKTLDNEPLDSPIYWADVMHNVTRQRFRLHYQLSYRGVEQIAAQQSSGPGPVQAEANMPPCPSESYRSAPFFHYSSASLDDVVEIIPCRRMVCPNDTPYWVITGILLRYEDGSQDCAGEFRLDCAGEPIIFEGAPVLQLGANDRTDSMYWHVSIIDTQAHDDFLHWRGFGMDGTLQWWFADEGRSYISWIDNMGETHPASLQEHLSGGW
ncbi:hypothetical protein CEP54_014708 [Fusarium duplospermum]|uniref:Uncharacterized protein n=1 Tax=Fusarium duplospermum TaxID=1325734 RepID=A0A428NUF9_9HYPO|nr:hypothetical protein CEP54_014708 [Fusarium duplospermum]